MRNLLVILIALLIGGAAAFYAVTMLSPPKVQEPAAAAPANPARIVVAARDLPVGAKITPDVDLLWVEWPPGSINAETMIHSDAGSPSFPLDSYKDWYVSEAINARQPILLNEHGITAVPPKGGEALDIVGNDPTQIKFTFAEAGNIAATGAKKVDVLLLRPVSMLGGADWTEQEPIAKNVVLNIVHQVGAAQGSQFTVNLDPDLVKQIELARSMGFITLVPAGEAPENSTARVCVGTKCFQSGKLVAHRPAKADGRMNGADMEDSPPPSAPPEIGGPALLGGAPHDVDAGAPK